MVQTTTQTTKKRRKPRSQGTARQAKMALFAVLRELESRVIPDMPLEDLTRLGHALATVSGAWSRVHQTHELEKRIESIETQLSDEQIALEHEYPGITKRAQKCAN